MRLRELWKGSATAPTPVDAPSLADAPAGRVAPHLDDLAIVYGLDPARLGRLHAFTRRYPAVVDAACADLYAAAAKLPPGRTRTFYETFRQQMPMVVERILGGTLDEQLEAFIQERMALHDQRGTDFSRMFGICGRLSQATRRVATAEGLAPAEVEELAGTAAAIVNAFTVLALTSFVDRRDAALDAIGPLREAAASIDAISRQLAGQVEAGGGSGTCLTGSMSQVEDELGSLTAHTGKVDEVVGLVKGLADQTNLLALNATIEAARAGEHGRGFTVVAGEVKELAKTTNDSLAEISGLVVEIRSSIERMTNLVGGMRAGAQDILGTADDLSDLSQSLQS